jgi:hypothetical protein
VGTARAPVPSAIRVECGFRKTPHASESLIGKADDVTVEIVTRITQVPHEITAAAARTVPIRRHWFVSIAQPPDRVNFLPDGKSVRWIWNVNNENRMIISHPNPLRASLSDNLCALRWPANTERATKTKKDQHVFAQGSEVKEAAGQCNSVPLKTSLILIVNIMIDLS